MWSGPFRHTRRVTPAQHLNDLLDFDLPLAELSAARLDGEVAALGHGYAPIDVPAGVSARARSLARVLPRRLIADRRTAAWVHGAIERLPQRVDACARTKSRPSALLIFVGSIREVVIDDAEVTRFDSVCVTTPLRTIFDLLREAEFDGDAARVVQRLAALYSVSHETCTRYLDGRPHLPNKALTRSRLARALSPR